MQPENRKKNFYCGDKVDYDEQCTSQCDRCVDAKGVDYGYLPEKMKNIWTIPSDSATKLAQVDGVLVFGDKLKSPVGHPNMFNYQNIYITNDEEIKEGDWCYYENGDLKGIHKVVNGQRPKTMILKKIILTTDQDLIKEGIQEIPTDFLEWFVKNPSCEFVKVRKDCCGQCDERLCEIHDLGREETKENTFYKIIIPKEEINEDDHYMDSYGVTKSEFDTFLHMKRKEKSLINMTCTCMRPLPGDFIANCRNCGFRIKDGFDHSLDVLKSAVKNRYPESAEEEVLDKIKFVLSAGNSGQAIRLLEQYGAYKQEGMYSEDEVLFQANRLLNNLLKGKMHSNMIAGVVNDWYDQFKKK
jgi:hypothetical protein